MPSSIALSSVRSRPGSPRLRAAIGALVLVAAACGSEPPLPAAEYFPAVEEELVRLDLATRDLTERFAGELESEISLLVEAADGDDSVVVAGALDQITAITKDKMRAIIGAHTGQLQVFADRVAELRPPESITTAHDELVGAMAGWAATNDATTALIDGAEDLAALSGVITGSAYADAQLRVDQACRALVDNAISVEVMLTCPGTQLGILEVAP